MGNLWLKTLLWISNKREKKFREWVEQEVLKEKLIKAVRDNLDEFPNHLMEYVSTALHVPVKFLENLYWEDVVEVFYKSLLMYPQVDLPITRPYVLDTESKQESWEYDGRTWHFYSHLLASRYGWTIEYISQLHVADALATIQEILTEDQLQREFTYSLSDIAYPYDRSTKKNYFKPLPRPPWMRPQIKEIKMRKVPAHFIPVGVVNYDAIPKELQPKEIVH